MDYNKTINLPKTEFPMRAGLPKREPETVSYTHLVFGMALAGMITGAVSQYALSQSFLSCLLCSAGVDVYKRQLRPRLAMAVAREAVTVLLPTPPLPLTTAMTFLILDFALAGAFRSREEQSAPQEEQSCVHSDIGNVSFLPTHKKGGHQKILFKTAGAAESKRKLIRGPGCSPPGAAPVHPGL